MRLTTEQKDKFIDNLLAGDSLGFEYLESIGYKADQRLLDLNLYIELKVSLLKAIEVYHLL